MLLLVIVQATTGQAPGDEDDVCLDSEDVVKEEPGPNEQFQLQKFSTE